MKNRNLVNRVLLTLSVMCLGFSASAFAAKDDLLVTNVNSVTVGTNVPFTSTNPGGNRQLTITDPIVGAQPVSVNVTWGIQAGNAPRTTTYPNNGVTFSTETSQGTSVGVVTVTPATCDFASATSTCSSTISFTTPNVTDTIQLKITPFPPSKSPANKELQAKFLFINFSVIQKVEKLDTALAVPNPQCFIYGAGQIGLTATLTELLSGNAISDRGIDFSLDGDAIGSANTDTTGKATLNYDINALSAGDYNLYAEFLGDSTYNGSNNSATLGISYLFVGFQQPINPEGNSVFGNGQVIPIKIKLADANNQPVPDATPTVWLYQYSLSTGLGEVIEPATSVSAADTGNIMRYVPADNHYIYNWDLSSLTNGTYAVVVDLGDSSACSKGPYYAVITVAKKGGKK